MSNRVRTEWKLSSLKPNPAAVQVVQRAHRLGHFLVQAITHFLRLASEGTKDRDMPPLCDICPIDGNGSALVLVIFK